MLEVSPSSEWCQRWGGRHSWRHRSDGGFQAERYTVEAIDELIAKGYVERNHYSNAYPATSWRFGLFDGTRLVGTCVFGVPTNRKTLTNVLPELEAYRESTELSRLVLADEVPANGESWFVARCFEELSARGVLGIVTFADPQPRVIDARVLFPGHVGHIYKALSGVYTGRGTAGLLKVLPDGRVVSRRAMQKVRKQERGHEHVERMLIAAGARPLRAAENPTVWLNEALAQLTVPIRHRGNHRYVFAIGGRVQRQRTRRRIPVPPQPYPEELDAA
jgi:hypothetical protein